jgi:hypothetical protein
MDDRITATLGGDTPPEDLGPPLQALWWLRKGGLAMGPAWERAHDLCQAGEGTRACDLVHALVHRIEGDDTNAGYWYRRAGETPGDGDLTAEWVRIAALLSR